MCPDRPLYQAHEDCMSSWACALHELAGGVALLAVLGVRLCAPAEENACFHGSIVHCPDKLGCYLECLATFRKPPSPVGPGSQVLATLDAAGPGTMVTRIMLDNMTRKDPEAPCEHGPRAANAVTSSSPFLPACGLRVASSKAAWGRPTA